MFRNVMIVGGLVAAITVGAVPDVSATPVMNTERQPAVDVEIPPPGATQELVLKDGSRLYGRVERVEGDRVTFRTVAGTAVEIERAQIASLRVVRGELVGGEFRPSDPNTTRLFFAPTGRTLRRGEGYFGVYEIMLPFVQVGITDRFSIGAGTPLIFGGGAEHPFWLTPKIQLLERGRTSVAAGVLHFFNAFGDGDGHMGIAYGVVTQGTPEAAGTIGVGYGYDDDGGTAIVMIGAEKQVRRSLKFLTENYLFPGGGLLSGGVRFFGDRLSADVGLIVPLNAGELIGFPMVNFVWRF